jgi:poly(ADP-ribose) glycohydrolase ARH3
MGIFDLKSKFVGAMVGSALGDAIGELAFMYPKEALLREALNQLSEMRYTDDTAMAIGLAESIIKSGGVVDEQHLGNTFAHNFAREPWRGYASGPPTVFSLAERSGIGYSDAAKSLFGGQGSFGNGAAMRIVPVGLFFYDSEDVYEHACTSAQVTHAHPLGMDGAAVQAVAISRSVGIDPRQIFSFEIFIDTLVNFAKTSEIRDKMELVRQLLDEDSQPDTAANRIGRTVAVHESMPFAVYSFLRHVRSFEDCLFCAIMNGGDRDTLGAMAGAISGAYLGIDPVPEYWQQKLENIKYIKKLASVLADMCISKQHIP